MTNFVVGCGCNVKIAGSYEVGAANACLNVVGDAGVVEGSRESSGKLPSGESHTHRNRQGAMAGCGATAGGEIRIAGADSCGDQGGLANRGLHLGPGTASGIGGVDAQQVLYLDRPNGDRSANSRRRASANSCPNPRIDALAIASAQGNGTGDREVGGVNRGGGITKQDVDRIGATSSEGTTASATTDGDSHRCRFSGEGDIPVGRFGLVGRNREGSNLGTGGNVLENGGRAVVEGVTGQGHANGCRTGPLTAEAGAYGGSPGGGVSRGGVAAAEREGATIEADCFAGCGAKEGLDQHQGSVGGLGTGTDKGPASPAGHR